MTEYQKCERGLCQRILLKKHIEQMEDDVVRLIMHCAYMGSDLKFHADNVDASTESFISLPDHLQALINSADDKLPKELQD